MINKEKININQFFGTEFMNNDFVKPNMDFYTVPLLFPYNLYDKDSGLFINENSVGFLLEIDSISGFDDEDIDSISSYISSLDEFFTMSVMNYASPDIDGDLDLWQKDKSQNEKEIFSQLASERVKYQKQQKFKPLFDIPQIVGRDFRIILSLSITIDDFRKSRKNFIQNIIEKDNLDFSQKEFLKIAKKLSKYRTELKSIITSLNSSARDMNSDNLIDLLRLILSFDKKSNKANHNLVNPINREITDGVKRIEVKDDHLIINNGDDKNGDFFARTLTVSDYREYWSQNCNDNLIGLFTKNKQICTPIINCYSFKVISQPSASKKANARMVRATQLAESSMAKFLPKSKKKLQDAKFVADKIADGNKMIETIQNFTIFSKNKEKLDKDTQDVKNILEESKFKSSIDSAMQLNNFLIQMPFVAGNHFLDDYTKLGISKRQVSWTASNLIPLLGEWKGNLSKYTEIKRGEGLVLYGRRGGLLNWSPFQTEVGFNCAIIGGTGSGKSFFMQEIVASHLASNTKVFIIDDGYSFENLTNIADGEFIEFSDEKQININPFGFININDLAKSSEYRRDVSIFLKNIIARMCRNDTECSEEEKIDISKALDEILNNYIQTKTIPIITDIAKILKNQASDRSKNLGELLYNFTDQGIYGLYFNKGKIMDIDNLLMTFELSKIKSDKHLLAVVMMSVMYLVSEYIYVKKGTTKSLIVIDEGWAMLNGGKSMVEFIEGLARRCRKYAGSIITGTQKATDYTANQGAKACLDNSDWTLLLRQNPSALKDTKEILDLNDRQMDVIKSIQKSNKFSEIIIKGGSTFTLSRFICDPFSAMLYSTKKEHKDRKRALINEGYSTIDAVKIATKEFFNYG
ncbi:TraC family protein [Rickettsiales bacterium]|nr:TraC family protein [Rickettsiales bacterium]